MGRKKIEEVKENENLKQEAVTKVAENEDVVEEKVETTVEDVKVKENTSEEKQDTEVQVTEEADKNATVKEIFRDKYDEKIIYNVGDVFIEDETLQDNKPVESEKGKYKVSKERYEELKRSLYVN